MNKAVLALLVATSPLAAADDLKPVQIPEAEAKATESKPYHHQQNFYVFAGAGIALVDDYFGDQMAFNGGFGYQIDKHISVEFDYARLNNEQQLFNETVDNYSISLKADQHLTAISKNLTVYGRFGLGFGDYECKGPKGCLDGKNVSSKAYDPVVAVGTQYNWDNHVFARAQYTHYPTNIRANLNYITAMIGYRF